MNLEPSDECLNALIDGELAASDVEPLLEQLRTDAALRERVGQLRLAKAMTRHAYADLAPPRLAAPGNAHGSRWPLAVAASLAFVMGGLLGWLAREVGPRSVDSPVQLAVPRVSAPHRAADRVVLHLGSAAPQHAVAVLDRAEGILEAARAAGRPVLVEIVANSGGLDLLRAGVSGHAERIAMLQLHYPQLALVACGQTAQRLRDGGAEVRLLPGTIEATSALDEIVLRMQQGWSYLRI